MRVERGLVRFGAEGADGMRRVRNERQVTGEGGGAER